MNDNSTLPVQTKRQGYFTVLEVIGSYLVFVAIYLMTKVGVAPTALGGPMSFVADPQGLAALICVTLLSWTYLDIEAPRQGLSQQAVGLLLAFCILIPVHMQLIKTPYGCRGIGCGNEGESVADPLQYLYLIWLAFWLLISSLVEFQAKRPIVQNKSRLSRKKVFYHLCGGVMLGIGVFLLVLIGDIFNIERLVGALLLGLFAAVYPLMLFFNFLFGEHKVGYGEIFPYFMMITFELSLLSYLVSLQTRRRWMVTVGSLLTWFLFGDTILKALYSRS